jgi:polynucleotide 5'-kinase involved in rRNA processing
MRLGSKRCIFVGVLDDSDFFEKEIVFVTKMVIGRCKKMVIFLNQI